MVRVCPVPTRLPPADSDGVTLPAAPLIVCSSQPQVLESVAMDLSDRGVSDPIPPAGGFTVPEPQEILAWVSGLRGRLRTYLGDPRHQVMWGIILLACALRLGYLDLIEFRLDQAQRLLRALEFTKLHLPSTGVPSSEGIATPPLMSYLLSIPVAFSRDPRVASAFVALLNVVAVIGCYRLARRYYGMRVAIIAAALFAVSPWAVVFSRRISPQGVLVPLGVWLLDALHIALVDRNPWGWVAAFAALGALLLTSLLAAPLALVLFVLVIIYHRRARWPHLLLGGCLLAIILMPYLHYQNVNRFEDFRTLVQNSGQRAREPRNWVRAYQLASRAHSGQYLSSLARPSDADYEAARVLPDHLSRLAGLVFLVSLPAMIVLAVRTWSHWREHGDTSRSVILAVWLWLPLLALSVQGGPLDLGSFVILYPAGFLGMALLADRVLSVGETSSPGWSWWIALLRIGVWLTCLLVVLWHVYSVVNLYAFVAHEDTGDGYGVPYRFWRQAAGLARGEVKEAETDEAWVIADGSDVTREEMPMLFDYLLGPDISTVFLGKGGSECALLPVTQSAVYLLARSSPLSEQAIRRLGGQDRGVVVFPGGQSRVTVNVVGARLAEEALDLIQTRGLWALGSGLRLLGYDWPADARPGQAVSFSTYWTFADVSADERDSEHTLYAYLVAQDGTKVAECDGFGLAERYWREGLLLQQWCTMQLTPSVPAGDYNLFAGVYRPSDSGWDPHVDAEGQAPSSIIPLGRVQVSR